MRKYLKPTPRLVRGIVICPIAARDSTSHMESTMMIGSVGRCLISSMRDWSTLVRKACSWSHPAWSECGGFTGCSHLAMASHLATGCSECPCSGSPISMGYHGADSRLDLNLPDKTMQTINSINRNSRRNSATSKPTFLKPSISQGLQGAALPLYGGRLRTFPSRSFAN